MKARQKIRFIKTKRQAGHALLSLTLKRKRPGMGLRRGVKRQIVLTEQLIDYFRREIVTPKTAMQITLGETVLLMLRDLDRRWDEYTAEEIKKVRRKKT